jgi:hypothetical protein
MTGLLLLLSLFSTGFGPRPVVGIGPTPGSHETGVYRIKPADPRRCSACSL